MESQGKQPRIAHSMPGRVRIKFAERLDAKTSKLLEQDLKTSPEVKNVTFRGTSLIIEHNDDERTFSFIGNVMNRFFPEATRWSDSFDEQVAKLAADPWINKSVPLAILSLALYRGYMDGAILAGESAFALAYLAFDTYWKFQQENVIRKIEQGMNKGGKQQMEQQASG